MELFSDQEVIHETQEFVPITTTKRRSFAEGPPAEDEPREKVQKHSGDSVDTLQSNPSPPRATSTPTAFAIEDECQIVGEEEVQVTKG